MRPASLAGDTGSAHNPSRACDGWRRPPRPRGYPLDPLPLPLRQPQWPVPSRLLDPPSLTYPDREAGIDEPVRQALSGEPTPLEYRVEADPFGVANAHLERGERPAFVEIRGVNRVSGCARLIGESKESGCRSLRVVKQQYLGHHGIFYHTGAPYLPASGRASTAKRSVPAAN